VHGIGQEDLYYGYDADGELTPDEVTQDVQSNLDVFLNAGKTVLTVDYPFSQSEDVPHFDAGTVAKIQDTYEKSRNRGYVPYCTVRNLSYLTINPGLDPTGIHMTDPPDRFQMVQNYPNPFNDQTAIRYRLSASGRVKVKVTDLQGRGIAVLADAVQPAGQHIIRWNATGIPSGLYFCRIETGKTHGVKKMTLLK